MKNTKGFNKDLSIKHSILLLTLLPSLLITAVLTTYLILSRQSDAQNELFLQSKSVINYLVNSSELALFSGDLSTLVRLGNAAILNNEIISVTFLDSTRIKLATIGEKADDIEIKSTNTFYSQETNTNWIFQSPVFNSEIEVDDFVEDNKQANENVRTKQYLGWIQVIADKAPLIKKQRNILLAGLGVGSFIFGLLAFAALRFSHSITNPLDKLTKTVRVLESGDLDARVSVSTYGELKELVNGVNKLANKVKFSNKQLNNKINEATHKLTSTLSELEVRNIELEVTSDELVTASNTKDEFLASVSHELRTPLTSIIGYTELLKKSELQNEQIKKVDTISRASKILLQLIDNILDFSKLDSESLELESIPFNLSQLLSDVSALHMPAAMDKDIKLQLTKDINLVEELIGDPLRIKQILNNLIQNAIKFTNKGSVIISVSSLDNKFGLLFKITDTGIGINQENQSRLFEPFNQLDASITRRFGGTGLGLVICKKLVSQFGGTIEVNSEINKGTEVVFSIVNIHRQEKPRNTDITYLEKKSHTIFNHSLTGKLVLLAEDNAFVRNLLIKTFEYEGAQVIAKEDGSFVLDAINIQKPDLVVLDYQMPLLDGIETSKALRRYYSSQELPIILLTADVINISNKEMENIGINDVIYKPIQGDELITCSQKLLNETKNNNKKVLDIIPDDLLKDELKKLQETVIKTFESKDYIKLKKTIHQLCGIAGPSSKYKKIWKIAKEIDLKVQNKQFDEIGNHVQTLKKITI